MDNATRNYINDLAQIVIDVYNIRVPIENIDEVVQKIGGSIEIMPSLDDVCDGTIRKNGEYSFSIAVSPSQNPQRKTFTIAHELGHLFLHMGFRTNKDLWALQDLVHRNKNIKQMNLQRHF